MKSDPITDENMIGIIRNIGASRKPALWIMNICSSDLLSKSAFSAGGMFLSFVFKVSILCSKDTTYF
jgi:hypothetical protein